MPRQEAAARATAAATAAATNSAVTIAGAIAAAASAAAAAGLTAGRHHPSTVPAQVDGEYDAQACAAVRVCLPCKTQQGVCQGLVLGRRQQGAADGGCNAGACQDVVRPAAVGKGRTKGSISDKNWAQVGLKCALLLAMRDAAGCM